MNQRRTRRQRELRRRRARSGFAHHYAQGGYQRSLLHELLEERRLLAIFTVDTLVDTVDVIPGDGVAADENGNTSLRAAIMESNALSGSDTINLPAGVYQLSIARDEGNDEATGDLDITSDITIIGAGADVTTIDAKQIDRVIDIDGDASISGVTITGGDRTGAYGGGIGITSGHVLIGSVVVTDNYGRFGTGGIANQGDLTITNSEISNNKTDFEAGAVWVWGDTGKATIRNTTISGNEADNAGGIAVWKAENSLTLENVTIYDNSAQFGGGGLKFEAGTVEMLNSIVAGNTASDGNDIRGTIVSLGNNIIGDTTKGAGFIASDLKDVDPQLGDLVDAGGTTRVHLPLAGSPAVDAGVSTETSTDQIGQLRGSDGNRDGTGAFDIGAVELVLTPEDFGDAPSPYSVTYAEDGARHLPIGSRLGNTRDAELTGTHSSDASADGSDEDGVTFGTVQVGQLDATVMVNVQNAPEGAKLDAWIDFNGDGSWGGPGEQIADTVAVVNGDNTLEFDVPSWAPSGQTFARFRLSTSGDLGIVGAADDGEVEDVPVTIVPPVATSSVFGGQNVISTDAVQAWGAATADLDNDGDMDIISASRIDQKVAWYENDGNQVFTTHPITTAAGEVETVFTIDLDGDRDIDILAASQSGKIEWYENDGSGQFTIQLISNNTDGALDVYAADIDHDGDMDIFTTSWRDNKLSWFENNGDETFTEHHIGDRTRRILVADIDNDGDSDILAGGKLSPHIRWHENDGSQTFTTHTISTDAGFTHGLTIGDIDSDGDLDLASASTDDNEVSWYENDGEGNFTIHSVASANDPTSVVAVDYDGDGDVDLIVSADADNEIQLFESDGNNNPAFTKHVITSLADGIRFIVASDIDNDGDLDILSASANDNKIAWYENNATPTLDPIDDLTIDEDAPEQTVNLIGITAGGSESQPLRVTAVSSDTTLIPDPVVTYPASDWLTDGLVASYSFTGNALDETGHGHDGTVTGASLTTDRFGTLDSAFSFDGTDDWIDLGNVVSRYDVITMSAWVKTTSTDSGVVKGIVSQTHPVTSGGSRIGFYHGQLDAGFVRNSPLVVERVLSTETLNDGNWHLATHVNDGSTFQLYVDGQLNAEMSYSPGPATTDSSMLIGKELHSNHPDGSGQRFFQGEVDDVRIYDRPLSASEVAKLYNESLGILQFTPLPDQNGSTTITVTVEDGGLDNDLTTTADNATTSQTFDVTVNPINDLPTLDPISWNLQAVEGANAGENFGYSVAISQDGQVMAVGSLNDDTGGNQSGKVSVFRNESATWVPLGEPLLGQPSERAGYVVTLNATGNVLAFSNHQFGAGSVYLYQFNEATEQWESFGQTLQGTNDGDQFGTGVELDDSGNRVVIGAADGNYAKVFEYDGTSDTWSQLGNTLTGHSRFGRQAAMSGSGEVIVIGAQHYGSMVYAYNSTSGNWEQHGGDILKQGSSDIEDVTISQDGSVVATGEIVTDNSTPGHTRVFQYAPSSSSWIMKGNLIEGQSNGDWFGYSVSLTDDGERLTASGYLGDLKQANDGYVRVYDFNGATAQWDQAFEWSGENSGDYAGHSVGISGDGTRFAAAVIRYNDDAGKVVVFDAYLTIAEDAPEQTMNLTGITAGGGEVQPLRVTAVSSDTDLIPNPTVTYTSAEATGTLSFTPLADQNGTATITVTVEDGGLDNNLDTLEGNGTFSRTFQVDVTPVNDLPIAGDATYRPLDNTRLDKNQVTGLATLVTDIDEDALTFSVVAGPSDGQLVLNEDGSFHYTPSSNFNRNDFFTYVANDGTVDSNIGTVTLKIDTDYTWYNCREPRDVNADNLVTPLDVLWIINSLNSDGSRELSKIRNEGIVKPFMDVNRDAHATPLDALWVINYLNQQPLGEGEGASETPAAALAIDRLMSEQANSTIHPERASRAVTTGTFSQPVPDNTPYWQQVDEVFQSSIRPTGHADSPDDELLEQSDWLDFLGKDESI